MMVAMDVGARYLSLVLRFRRLAPSLVDSYVGSAELAERVDAEVPLVASELAERAADLRADVTRLGLEDDRGAAAEHCPSLGDNAYAMAVISH
jgi:hypothetical protein